MDPDIEFRNVTFAYEGASSPALKHIDLTVSPGEIILVTGPAGSGKTTLCGCVNGLVPHHHAGTLDGEIRIRGNNTKRTRIGALASLVGMVFQDPESQLVTSSVADEVAFGPENLGVPRTTITERVEAALRATRLAGYDDREPHSLSGGEQQACAIAAIHAMHPEIYVMDEPLANLDPAGRAQVLALLVDVAKKREKTLLLVEHALEEVLPLVDRIIVLDRGEIARDGPVREVLAAGDLARVFTRPFIVRLAERFAMSPLPLTPDEFHERFTAGRTLALAPAPVEADVPVKSGKAIIELQDVAYSYDGASNALDGVSLTIHEGELVAILGRNGSGKTTLIRHLIGLLHPDRGSIAVMGHDVARTPTHVLARDVGFCFQNPNHQIVCFTVRDEMKFGLEAHNIDPAQFDSRIREALALVDMADHLDAEIFDLGKGQKQRVALASVLTLRTPVLIIDEPTTGQDPHMAEEIFAIIKGLNEAGTTILVITHAIDFAARFASRALVMQSGKVAFDGSTRELLADADLMQRNSLDLPSASRLASRLRANGLPHWLMTLDEMETALKALEV